MTRHSENGPVWPWLVFIAVAMILVWCMAWRLHNPGFRHYPPGQQTRSVPYVPGMSPYQHNTASLSGYRYLLGCSGYLFRNANRQGSTMTILWNDVTLTQATLEGELDGLRGAGPSENPYRHCPECFAWEVGRQAGSLRLERQCDAWDKRRDDFREGLLEP